MSRLVASLRPLQELESDRRSRLSWLLHTRLTGLAGTCHAHAQRLSPAMAERKEDLPSLLNDLEVQLGAVVEARCVLLSHVDLARQPRRHGGRTPLSLLRLMLVIKAALLAPSFSLDYL